MSASDSFDTAIAALLVFLEAPLTATIGQLEHDLADRAGDDVKGIVEGHGISGELLSAALVARERLGRINDVIHAAAIAVVLPHLLDSDELLRRPSLAAGNDPTRPFDVETDRRIAEFKLARWRGADAMRKRQSFKDLVELAAEPSNRQRHLFVLGQQPIHFLRTSKSTAAWALDRFPAVRERFVDRFGPLETPINVFTTTQASHVELVDLQHRWPALFPRLNPS
jgi:hypothetical protein